MDDLFEKTLLYDFYGELLTDNQKCIYEMHHSDDFSLGEISEQMKISRQGVFDTLKRCEHQLNHYEEKLQLVAKFVQNKTRVQEIHQLACSIIQTYTVDDSHLIDQVKNIEELSKSILEDL